MPTYAKFIKDILSNKRSLGGSETVKLTEQCSAILRNELPPKLEDPGKFSIPCTIGKANIKQALCDLGASVSLMPRSIYERLGIGELKPTRMTLQLADSSVRLPLGILEDVPIQVGKFFVPGDFVVMEMEEDKEVPIILGRPFLRTAGALIDVKEGTLTLRIGDEKVQFDLNRTKKYPDRPETCCAVYMGKKGVEEMGCAAEVGADRSQKQAHGPDGSYPDRVPTSEKLTHKPDEPHTLYTVRADQHTARAQVQPEQLRLKLKSLVTTLDPDRTSRLAEDLKAQQTVIWNLIEKLTGTNPAACMHRTLPANDHRHTVRADLHTDRAHASWPVQSVPWSAETTRWSYPFEPGNEYPLSASSNREGGAFKLNSRRLERYVADRSRDEWFVQSLSYPNSAET